MRKGYHISRPVLVGAAGSNTDEFMRTVLSGSWECMKKSRKGHLIAESDHDRDSVSASLLEASLRLLRDDASLVLSRFSPDRIGVVLGACDYGSSASRKAHMEYIGTGSFGSYDINTQNPVAQLGIIKERFGFQGPSFTVASACSSGAQAIIRAIDLLEAGYADAVLAGGIDIASDIIEDGFTALTAISDGHTNPFSRNRDGINLGDGAGFMFISKERIFPFPVSVTGFSESSDGYNMTSPEPSGEVVAVTLRDALSMAGLAPEDIGYINLHGTGTHDNDMMESRAVHSVFPESVPVSSTKPVTGHTLGAAGAIEAGIAAMTIASPQPALLPPHIFDGEEDPELPHLHFAGIGEKSSVTAAISSSFAFGGCNAVILLERDENE